MNKKILSIFLCISLVLTLLTACNESQKPVKDPTNVNSNSSNVNDDTQEENEGNNDVPSDESTTVKPLTKTEYIEIKKPILNDGEKLEGEVIPLYTGNKAVFRIIRSSSATPEIVGYAAQIKDAVKKNLDITIEYKPDSVVAKEGMMEVIVGETNREGYNEIYEKLINYRSKNKNDWTIKVVGDKIFIVGGSNVAIEYAVNYFIERFCTTLGAIITTEYCYEYKHDMSNSFTINGSADLEDYKIIMPKYNMSYIVGRELDDVSAALMRYNSNEVEVLTDKETESKYEILVGSTNRGSVANIRDKDVWQISVKGSKVYLEGGSNYSNAVAVIKFIEMIKSGVSLKDGDIISGKYSETIKEDTFEDYYTLTVSDEFEEPELNSTLWGVKDITAERMATDTNKIWNLDGAGRNSGRKAENVSIRDGNLVGKCTYDDTDYWGFNVHSTDKFWFQYGLVEISARIPMGEGLWAGFWLQGAAGAKSYTEFDIFESGAEFEAIKQSALLWGTMEGKDAYNGVNDNLGTASKDKFTWNILENEEDFNKYYHTIGLEWDENQYTMTCDGRPLYTVEYSNNEEITKTIQQMVYVQISCCVDFKSGGSGPYDSLPQTFSSGCIPGADYWNTSNEYIVEYFHLYQKPGSRLTYRTN